MKKGFFTNGCFRIGDEREIDTKRFLKDRTEFAKFIDKILDNYDNHPPIYYTVNCYRHFKNFKLVNRSDHGRGANEFHYILESDSGNYYMTSGKG